VEFKVGLIKIFDEVLGIQVILRDVTQQKKIEKERIEYTEKLETLVQERTNQIIDNEKMVAIAKVSSMIAHDLKGPLQVIQNTLYLMKVKPENMHEYMEFIGSAVKQANDLIEEIRAKGKQTPLYLENVSLTDLIDESLLQVKVNEYVTFETLIDSERIVQLDRSKFIRVLNNLLKNAVEAMPNGGKITILVEEKGNELCIKIMDTGTGISQNKIDNLFRPFQSTKSKGMGLGLTFCKKTVESHGGTISVESEVGKGTTFIITIPIMKDEIKNLDVNAMNKKDTLIE
jgi:signal transduction histidine kinase